ncbi:hypothetical protein [Bacillus swezeyi]|nr:hypothetical protein [Bacillus swezeyi]
MVEVNRKTVGGEGDKGGLSEDNGDLEGGEAKSIDINGFYDSNYV